MQFTSTIFTIPGLGGSGPQHWQSLWENQFNFIRVEQADWDTPVCADWVENINNEVKKHDAANLILVAHSLACNTLAYWAQKYKIPIKAALLVAPADTEADSYPAGITTGFTPMVLNKFPFKTITVASTNDFYVAIDRAELFAKSWGSQFINAGEAGHINVGSGYGEWDFGLQLLQQLDNKLTV